MMNPVRAVMLGVAALATIPTRLGARPTVNPATLVRDIDARGPRAVIATLARTGQWDGVVRHIDGGGDAWLAVAAKLAPGSDAGSAEDLGISLATALPRNAAGVLRIMRLDGHNPLRAARVCGLPFIEQPKAQTDTYRASAVDAVTRVSDPALADRRSRCLAALRR
jgi:hypothetical protein